MFTVEELNAIKAIMSRSPIQGNEAMAYVVLTQKIDSAIAELSKPAEAPAEAPQE